MATDFMGIPDYEKYVEEEKAAGRTPVDKILYYLLYPNLPNRPKGTIPVSTTPEVPSAADYQTETEKADAALKALMGTKTTTGLPNPAVKWGIIQEGGYSINVGYDKDGNIVSYDPIGAEGKIDAYPQPKGQIPKDKFGRSATWSTKNGEWKYPPDWGTPEPEGQGIQKTMVQPKSWAEISAERDLLDQQQQPQRDAQAASAAQWQQSFGLQQEQFEYQKQQDMMAQQTQQQNYLASLAANPKSWLEYSLAAKQTPVVQPWMSQLMPGNYSPGQTFAGWNQGKDIRLPTLNRPAAGYFLGNPDAQRQYEGYQQMATGATPEQTQADLWKFRPPQGANMLVRR